MKNKFISLILVLSLIFSGCSSNTSISEKEDVNLSATSDSISQEVVPEEDIEKPIKHEVIVYFANWYLDTKTAEEGAEVCSIPWDKVTYVNHAFWEIFPDDGSTATSFEQREQGKAPRTKFSIKSTSEKDDFNNNEPSKMAEGLPRNHFAQYEYYAQKYPDVNVLISIGGWTRCGYFSEMAYTPEGRTSFVNACIEVLEKYPWLDGIDIDWEYFGGSKDGERTPEDDNDQGCPIWGTVEEDSENFGLLAKELKDAMDNKFGEGAKKLTACASGSSGWTLPMQNWRKVAPYMDMINIMTYDMAGTWDKVTGHASRRSHAKDGISVLTRGYKADPTKLCIGTPMYGTCLKMLKAPTGTAVGVPIEPQKPNTEEVTQTMIRKWESEAVSGYKIEWNDGVPQKAEEFDNGGVGWHFKFDKIMKAAYMYNDDPNSEYYLWYISYENPLTLYDKLDLIREQGIAGIIIWESSEDTYDHQMITQIHDYLLPNE